MQEIRGDPKKKNSDFGKAIFERTFYFCKLSGISIEEYIKILKCECEKRGII